MYFKKRLFKVVTLILLNSLSLITLANTCSQFAIIQKPIIFNSERIAMTKAYRQQHYGIQDNNITITPEMIILHWTAMPTFIKSFHYFNSPFLAKERDELYEQSKLNVSAHFLVDRDGTIYQLMPTTWMARHAIGLNNIAIGIENVGGVNNKPDLTARQVQANACLIMLLKQQYPDIKHLIGHYEYLNFRNTPLWQEVDKTYHTNKYDPGPKFLSEVREQLKKLQH